MQLSSKIKIYSLFNGKSIGANSVLVSHSTTYKFQKYSIRHGINKKNTNV